MNKSNLTISVECYAGYRGEELPKRFFIRQKRIDVIEILDRWLAPDHPVFSEEPLTDTSK